MIVDNWDAKPIKAVKEQDYIIIMPTILKSETWIKWWNTK